MAQPVIQVDDSLACAAEPLSGQGQPCRIPPAKAVKHGATASMARPSASALVSRALVSRPWSAGPGSRPWSAGCRGLALLTGSMQSSHAKPQPSSVSFLKAAPKSRESLASSAAYLD